MLRLTICIIGLFFVTFNYASTKSDLTNNSNILYEIEASTNIKMQLLKDKTDSLLDIAINKDTMEFSNSETFLFLKSGPILRQTEKNALSIYCPTDTTYTVKLYSIKNNRWVLIDSIGGLEAFPSQFELTFDDYNFDKQTDIYIQVSASSGWSISKGHLLTVDPLTEKLTQHKETRELGNMKPDPKTKTVVSELWNGYNLKGQHQLTIFTNKWIKGKLRTIKKKEITLK
jgi:hypothetical protein